MEVSYMRQLRQLAELLDVMPAWAQFAIAAGLLAYSFATIYGRMNVEFGAKLFSKVPRDQIRTNPAHILQYTIIPVGVTIGYLLLLFSKYSGGAP
jgi:hypothetical protein